MQYERRSESSKNGPRNGKAADAELPNNAPLLRERLLDVVRRDRETAIAQRAAQRAALAGGQREPVDAPGDPVDAEAKSGTHVRLPDYARQERQEREDQEARDAEVERELDRMFEADEPTFTRAPQITTSWSKQAPQPAVAPIDLSEAQSMFASWIEEEIIEHDGASEQPIQYVAAPSLPAPGKPALPPVDLKKFALKKPSVPQVEEHAVALRVVESQPAEAGLESALEPEPVPDTLANTSEKQEPIRTRTMARLLAGHGYDDRALSIYDHLISRDPSDVSLRVEADALRAAKKK